MAVPAAFMSITSGMSHRAFFITSVSSHSDRLPRVSVPEDRACMIRARLLILFDAGRIISLSILSGAVIIYCIMILMLNISRQHASKEGCCRFSNAKVTNIIMTDEKDVIKFAILTRSE